MWIDLPPEIAEYRMTSCDDEPGAPYSLVRLGSLKRHVEEWVNANATGAWETRGKEIGRPLYGGEPVWWENHPAGKTDRRYKWCETIAISFENERDAVLFKTFWL